MTRRPMAPSLQLQKNHRHNDIFLLLSFIMLLVAALTNVTAFTNVLPGRNRSQVSNLSQRQSKYQPKVTFASSVIHQHHDQKTSIKASTILSLSDKNENDNDKKEELTLERIAELIEVSFVNACMQLATGYVDVLKLFVTSVKAAYERSITIPTLQGSLQSCPNQSANRPLMKEEEELRFVWVQLIYLTLQKVNFSEDIGNSVSEEVRNKYQGVVNAVVTETMQRNSGGEDDKQQKQQDNVPLGSSPLVKLEDLPSDVLKDFGDDSMAKALLAQNVRVVGVTLAVLEEEERCFGDGMGGDGRASSGASPPKPPIPGAF